MKLFPLMLIAVLISTSCLPRQLRPAVHNETRQLRPAVHNETRQQDLFFRFIDAETTSERDQALQTLQHDFPQSTMTDRAIKLDATRSAQHAKINKLDAELKRCLEQKRQQQTDNVALRKDLEQLKQLVIEMELRDR
jgi:hypothetical protein